jgi:16S rRNA (guanine527-N7)-methyltransferase
MPCENDTLVAALKRHSLELPADQVEKIDHYCRLLWDHNSRHNLTRHTDYETFVTRDVIDSIELLGQLQPADWVLDIGSGGGVPGILIAILRPDLGKVVLSEFVGKKTVCLQQMIDELGLTIEVVTERAENILIASQFDVVTARAVGPLRKMLPWFEGCWGQFKRMLLIKGPKWVEEKATAEELGLTDGLSIRCIHSYPMPGRDNQSVILELKHTE